MSVAGGGVSGECPQALVSADAHSWLTGYYPAKTSGDRQCRQPCQGIKGRLGHWSSFLCEQFSRRYLVSISSLVHCLVYVFWDF